MLMEKSESQIYVTRATCFWTQWDEEAEPAYHWNLGFGGNFYIILISKHQDWGV